MRDLRDGRLLTLLACAAVVGFGLATCGTEDGPESFDERRDSIAAAVAVRLHRSADSLKRQYQSDTARLTDLRRRSDSVLAAWRRRAAQPIAGARPGQTVAAGTAPVPATAGADTATLIPLVVAEAIIAGERKACDAVIATCEARLAVS